MSNYKLDLVQKFVHYLKDTTKEFTMLNIVTDLEKTVENYGIKVFYSDMSAFDNPRSVSGYSMVNENGQPEIVVNLFESLERQRFTIAHELGHILMHWGYRPERKKKLDKNKVEVLFRSTDKNNVREVQANAFAAELLLPFKEIEKVIAYQLNSSEELNEILVFNRISRMLQDEFKVSRTFAEIQLKKYMKA